MSNVTPMMAQYLEIKEDAPDALLFYRMGDFYEMFFDDAVAAAEALDIALTRRGKHQGADIPMCGVPAHSAENYFLTLIRKGFRVAVCEQLETPEEAKKRGSKSVVKRGIVRLVTPGTLTEDSLLEARRHNYLAAYCSVRDDSALAWVDISTGAFHVTPCSPVRLGPELARLGPREIVVAEGREEEVRETVEDAGAALTTVARSAFDSDGANSRLCALFGVATLEAYGSFSRAELGAMGAVVSYLDLTQRGQLPLLRPPVKEATQRLMQIDGATRRNLELTHSLSGGRAGSLLACIDRTLTAGGGRLLERRVSAPSTQIDAINARLDAITWANSNSNLTQTLRDALRKTPDMDRALSRLSLDRAGPRDLAAVRDGLHQSLRISEALSAEVMPDLIMESVNALIGHSALLDLLDDALVAEPPLLVRDGGMVAPDYNAELDEARSLRDEGRGVIAAMQADFVSNTGISSLKIKHNNVLGYFIEVTATHADKMHAIDTFIHRQTTANQVRFTTVELSELETKILNAGSRALELEKRIYETLRQSILETSDGVYQAARALSELDVTTALADLATGENWNRPEITRDRDFAIIGGRHPVVEAALKSQGAQFVRNDTQLTATETASISLLTGPNMAGKSTYLRQNALIALMAQIGSFVPAESARIGVVSQLFSRVGASDDLARGRSTFMVEMVETAAILNQADDRALVILDEIGRGTATYDGLSIAWATLEHLHDVNQCRALFATHYHEMTQLAAKLPGVENATVAVKEWEGDVIFLHEVRLGAADRSYGVQVAKLAGLPESVVARARLVLEALEKGEREGGNQKAFIDDLPLFAAKPVPQPAPQTKSAAEGRLRDVLPDELTPKEALNLIYELKALASD
ncbi:DNA mismatch repair protein MutS [Thalassobacter stenotrophicus]|uniref:DNA mismatch repair protein MutS n=2 Tax=Thalassobacter stenotrophicus TaxID=266809 RepID=A0A0P1FFR7_9RHOB|nr:DNA mismatch repair protein MutS [Thalassobacter stenotrophicus]CUH60591.1 DNA mismatch repair protein MutS [Thalassobacter stenotrophicus]SHJ24678.1 DNA mismatch repair protein MutS [Thalassobacter stenotrophicus DSM 16310]